MGKDKEIRVTYELMTPESAEQCDVAERGFVARGGIDVIDGDHDITVLWREAQDVDEGESVIDCVVAWLRKNGYTEPSSSDYSAGSWYSWPDAQTDMYTGDARMQSAHLEGFTREEEAEVGRVMALSARRFTLDGETVDILGFLRDNAETFSAQDREEVYALKVGDTITYGGGAAPIRVLKRER